MMKVYWQYAAVGSLKPTRGDYITELNSITAVSKFADVVYGGPPPPDCDVYYVRANPKRFNQIPKGKTKFYFASPYDKSCFDQATNIITFTNPWTKRLHNGVGINGAPDGVKYKKAVTTLQTLDPRFMPCRRQLLTRQIRKQIGGKFIIGHFGAVRKSCYPRTLLRIIDKLKKSRDVSIVYGGGNVPHKHIKHMTFDYKQMPYALSACDLILYNMYTDAGNWAGSMKTLEAMACGVPVIAPRLEARVEEFGKNYKLFYPWRGRKDYSKKMLERILWAIDNPDEMKVISNTLIKRAKKYSIKESSKRWSRLLNPYEDYHQNEGIKLWWEAEGVDSYQDI